MINIIKLGVAKFQDYEIYKWSRRNKKLKPRNSIHMEAYSNPPKSINPSNSIGSTFRIKDSEGTPKIFINEC